MEYSLGKKIKELRHKHSLTQDDLANELNSAYGTTINKGMISKWENDKEEPRIDAFRSISKFFNVALDELLNLNHNNENSFDEKSATIVRPYFSNIPLVGTVCAGDGLLAEQNIEEYIHYPFQSKRQPDFALRVKGNSMINAGIEEGDIVYIRTAQWAEYNGQIVVALINDEQDGTLKRMKWSEGSPTIHLIPENDKYDAIDILPNEVRVCGVYMGHFKQEKQI